LAAIFASQFWVSAPAMGRRWRGFPVVHKIKPFGARAQRGESRFKAIAFTAIVVFGIFAAVKLLPPYIAEYQLADKMQEQARFGIVNRYSEDKIREIVFKEAQDLDVPVQKEDIKVLVNQSMVRISVDYTVPIDLLVYKTQLHFTPSSENKSLL
jgi:hypothetical protein